MAMVWPIQRLFVVLTVHMSEALQALALIMLKAPRWKCFESEADGSRWLILYEKLQRRLLCSVMHCRQQQIIFGQEHGQAFWRYPGVETSAS